MGALMLLPVALTALGLIATEASRAMRPGSSRAAAPFFYSLADAIEGGDVQSAYAFIRAGQDPTALVAVRHPVLTEGRTVLVSPLLWAVATERTDAVLMLLGFGAKMDREPERLAACIADALGNVEIANALRTDVRAPSRDACPPIAREKSWLLSLSGTGETAR